MNLPDADLVDTRTAHEKKLEIVEKGFKAAVRALWEQHQKLSRDEYGSSVCGLVVIKAGGVRLLKIGEVRQ
jgi:hypothetical protein